MKKIVFLVCLSLFFWGGGVFASSKVITAAADPWPPFIIDDNDSQGLAMEIIRAAYKTQGYEVVMNIVPWARAEIGVRNGTYDLLPPTWYTEERSKVFDFSDAYAYNQVKFIKRKGDLFVYTDISDLTGKVIGVVRGYGYDDAFSTATNFKKYESADFITNIKMLVANRLDLTIEDEIVARSVIQQEDPALLDQIEFVDRPLSKKPLYLAVGLQNPRCKELISAFNKGLKVIKADGTYSKIVAKYGITF
ncbi:MAG: transporter substrate-binding domain-containing protein [Spirochaetales bacterium]|nr:transporter substrate-binding domain-containing protein [Spirochaetales bacterium]